MYCLRTSIGAPPTEPAKGEKEFKREAWLEAKTRGLNIKGYEPNKQYGSQRQKNSRFNWENLTPEQREALENFVGNSRF